MLRPSAFYKYEREDDSLSYQSDDYINDYDNYIDDFDNFDDFESTTEHFPKCKPKYKKTSNFNIDEEMIKAYHEHKDELNSEKMLPIDKNIYAYYNTLNVSCGRPGSGKSFLMCRDVIQISRICPYTHAILYISKTGMCDDKTFKSIQHLIKKPIEYLSENSAEAYIKKMQLYKQEYEKYKTAARPVVKPEVMEFLHVDDLTKPYLHTVLIFEDFVESKLVKNKYINWLFSELRHNHCTAFINVQFFKSITTDIKNNTTSFYIYPEYCRQQMQYMFRQIAIPYDFEEIYDRYKRMKNNEVLVINLKSKVFRFDELKMVKS